MRVVGSTLIACVIVASAVQAAAQSPTPKGQPGSTTACEKTNPANGKPHMCSTPAAKSISEQGVAAPKKSINEKGVK